MKEDIPELAVANFIYLLKNIGAKFFKHLLAVPS